jgi:hypothetical protein
VSAWRRRALEEFPERQDIVLRASGIYVLFADLFGELRAAYAKQPPDRDLIDRVYRFAEWCFAPKQNPNLRNAAAVSFYEHVPDFGPARADLARRFTPAMWQELQPLLFRMLPPESYDAFAALLPFPVTAADA